MIEYTALRRLQNAYADVVTRRAWPELESDIKNAPMVASFDGNKKKHRDAVAKGVSKCYKDWQDQVTVPGLPWYPAFAAFPGPMAPPMPNIPVPLIACPSSPDNVKPARYSLRLLRANNGLGS